MHLVTTNTRASGARLLFAALAGLTITFTAESAHADEDLFQCTTKMVASEFIVRCETTQRADPNSSLRELWRTQLLRFLNESGNSEPVERPPPLTPEEERVMCFTKREQPAKPRTLEDWMYANSFRVACTSEALKGLWDATGGFVINTCGWVKDRLEDPTRLRADLQAFARTANEMAFNVTQSILEPEVMAQRVGSACARGVSDFNALSRAEQHRALAEYCRAIARGITGVKVGRGASAVVAGVRGGAASAEGAQITTLAIDSIRSGATRATPVLPVLKATDTFSTTGSKNIIVRARLDGRDVLVKVPRPGQTTIAHELNRFPAPEHGGLPNCNRGLVKIEIDGRLTDGIAMDEIKGLSLDNKKTVVRRSHVDSFRQHVERLKADGKILDDLHEGNVMIGADGRVYIIDNAWQFRIGGSVDADMFDWRTSRILSKLEKKVQP